MGKGGEQLVDAKATPAANSHDDHSKGKAFKLSHMPTEELRKWAKAYALNDELERDDLLAALVRNAHMSHPNLNLLGSELSVQKLLVGNCLLTAQFIFRTLLQTVS